MFHLLFALAVAAPEVCDGVALKEGQVCCANKSCDYYCHKFDNELMINGTTYPNHVEYCVDKTQKLFCVETVKSIWIEIIVFCLPTIITLIVCCIKKIPITPAAAILCIGTNCSIACIVNFCICHQFGEIVSTTFCILFGAIGLWTMLVIGCVLEYLCTRDEYSYEKKNLEYQFDILLHQEGCAPKAKFGRGFCPYPDMCVFKEFVELGYDHIPDEELDMMIDENYSIPPTPIMKAMDFSRGKHGTTIYSENNIEIPYSSWQENGTIEKTKENVIRVLRCSSKYEFAPDIESTVEGIRAEAIAGLSTKKRYQIGYENMETAGMVKNAIGFKENDCFLKYCTSCFNHYIVYHFLQLFGYNIIIDAIWSSKVQRITFNSIKRISGTDSLRAKSGERDRHRVSPIEKTEEETKIEATNLV